MDEYITWNHLVHQLRESCESFDHIWIKRRRQFDTFSIISRLIELVTGSDKSYRQVLSGENLPFLSPPAASSFCVARSKLPAYIVDEVRKDNLDAWDDVNPDEFRWHGFRTFAVDGSKITLPRKLSDQGFKNSPSGFCPEALISVLFRLGDRMICDLRLSKRKDERYEAFFHLNSLTSRDLVIYDRGYISYNLIIEHLEHEVIGVFRVPNGSCFIEARDFWASDSVDAIVELNPSFPTKRKAKLAYPHRYREKIKLRLMKYFIDGKAYVLASTNLDQSISINDYIALYASRWGAEELYKVFKKSFSLEDFHSNSENGIEQELHATALMWNLSQQANKIALRNIKKVRQLFIFITLSSELPAVSLRFNAKNQIFSS